MFQRHSALGSEVLQYGLAYFSNFVNTKSARQYIAIFLKVCWFVCFYLFFSLLFPCCCLSQWSSDITGDCSHHGARGSEERSAQGWFLCTLSWRSSNSSDSPQWPGLWATIRNLFWILRSQAGHCSRQTKNGKSQWATNLPSLPTHSCIPNLIKGCSPVIITL